MSERSQFKRLETQCGLSNPTWLLFFFFFLMLATADSTGDFCLPSRSTRVVAGFRGLNQQPYTRSSKPVELGHDERVCPHKKKVQSDGQRNRNPLSGNILLCTSICCSVTAGDLDGRERKKIRVKCTVQNSGFAFKHHRDQLWPQVIYSRGI